MSRRIVTRFDHGLPDDDDEVPPIYAAPTTETLGDESFLRVRPISLPTPPRQHPPLPARRNTAKKAPANQQREFQRTTDLPTVTLRTVNTAQRSAFEMQPAISMAQWQQECHRRPHRVSPSLQHLRLIHKIQQQTLIRQLDYAPSFVPPPQDETQRARDDGRYRSIDPLKAMLQSLPTKKPPTLMHKKYRLPMRVDVGFPNASQREIALKQDEIRDETAWEEACPRLVVLVTSDDLGTTVRDTDDTHSDDDNRTYQQAHLLWNGGGLPGIPYAGRELMQAHSRNAQQFGRADKTPHPIFAEPSPYSMLAPPLDASDSTRHRWRPRPFHDRPPGRSYGLICPTRTTLLQPETSLVGCLALYMYTSKISEDFWFPVGSWPDARIQLDAILREDGSVDAKLLESWKSRLHKAIVTWDSLEMSKEEMIVVIQVYSIPYIQHEESGNKRSKSHSLAMSKENQIQRNYEQFGTQLLMPVAIGACQYSTSAWPHGVSQTVSLRPVEGPVAMEKWIEQWWGSDDDLPSSDVSTTKRKGVGRFFMTPKRSSRKQNSDDSVNKNAKKLTAQSPMATLGTITLFLSELPVDFLQAMLETPSEIDSPPTSRRPLPRLLVDISGDFAVMLDPNEPNRLLPEGVKKRSNLLRLPAAPISAGYVGSCEYRELLYFPPRLERHYEFDSILSYRSLLNLMYLYPKLLRATDGSVPLPPKFTVKFCVMRTEVFMDEDSGQVKTWKYPQRCFHGSSFWSGPALVEEHYTKLQGNLTSNTVLDMREGTYLHDEIKMRLPDILDGSYALHVILYSVEAKDSDGMSLVPVAEAEAIPLSTTSRDKTTGKKVTTIIPNGNHRLKLGQFQLQLETRLESAVHVGDPSVAAILRDFPLSHQELDEPSSSQPQPINEAFSISHDSSDDVKDSVVGAFAEASPSSVVSHFQALLLMHLQNLVKREGTASDPSTEAQMTMTTILSLFEVLRKASGRFQKDLSVRDRSKRWNRFVKVSVDAFDEMYLDSRNDYREVKENDEEDASVGDADSYHIEHSNAQNETRDDENEGADEHAVQINNRRTGRNRTGRRVSRFNSEFGTSTIPFSRVVYGVTKVDRMRIEAELHEQGGHFGHFFDDDETIATAPSFSVDQGAAAESRIGYEGMLTFDDVKGNSNSGDEPSVNTIIRTAPSRQSNNVDFGGMEFRDRIRTVAQVVFAPCVGPSLANILSGKQSTPRAVRVPEHVRKAAEGVDDESTDQFSPTGFWFPSSDEENEGPNHSQDGSRAPSRNESKIILRGPQDCPLFVFSLGKYSLEFPAASGKYLYETVMVLWLKAWLDDAHGNFPKQPDRASFSRYRVSTFPIPIYDPQALQDRPLLSFYANMDFFLQLCLKSIAHRYTAEASPVYPPTTRVLLDEKHMQMLEPFVEMIARAVVGISLSGLGSHAGREDGLLRALASCEQVVEFLIGLFPIFHSEHLRTLLTKFFMTLRNCETEHLGDDFSDQSFEWDEESLHRVRTSRQVRLRAIEMMSAMPSFISLNFPARYSESETMPSFESATWLQQHLCVGLVSSAYEDFPVDGIERLPPSGWLSDMTVRECLSICSLSCEAVVAEALAHIEESHALSKGRKQTAPSSLKKRPGRTLKRDELLMFQSISVHSVTVFYELILRRHLLDRRYQSSSSRSRLAGMFSRAILEMSISSVRWLARMEATHKVRWLWLLGVIYILQEAPDAILKDTIRSYCSNTDIKIHRFIRLLRLCSATFQSFIDVPRHTLEADHGISDWLLQESFNTLCATTNIVVEECIQILSGHPHEQRKLIQGILDLLLHILTTPQSPVTHLRAIGGALQALEHSGVERFIEIAGVSLQHWIRVVLSSMNSISLSVRSIAVDFVVSFLGCCFDAFGSIDEVTLVFATVLPEVVAREIGLFSVGGNLFNMEDVAKAIWPLRRAFSDLEDSNPLDDDRVDPQLQPSISVFCRACQSIMDGVLIELRLTETLHIIGTEIPPEDARFSLFDADEESLYEAANFFIPEAAPMQRIRWLLTLKSLHESKEQWIEAAEALFICARTISHSIPHLREVWRPSRFILWSDTRRSLWLGTVGEDLGLPNRGNTQVMDFADLFLEPEIILGKRWQPLSTGKLEQPTIPNMCEMLTMVADQAINLYLREDGMEEAAHRKLEMLLKCVMHVLDDHKSVLDLRGGFRGIGSAAKKRHVEEEASLRRTMASLSSNLTKISERLLVHVRAEPSTPDSSSIQRFSTPRSSPRSSPIYVAMRLFGKKPLRFEESTTIPTFIEWGAPIISRFPGKISDSSDQDKLCKLFAKPYIDLLKVELGDKLIVETEPGLAIQSSPNDDKTYLHIFVVDATMVVSKHVSNLFNKRFYYRKGQDEHSESTLAELTVARPFPCPLSRQRVLLTTEISLPRSAQLA